MTVKKFDELITDARIAEMIKAASLGEDIQWKRVYAEIDQAVIDPNTGQKVGTLSTPIMKVYLGMRGFLLGPQNHIWWTIAMNALPLDKELEEHIRRALASMREVKEKQRHLGNGPAAVPPTHLRKD